MADIMRDRATIADNDTLGDAVLTVRALSRVQQDHVIRRMTE